MIPLLLVGALGWLTLGPQLLEGLSLVAELQESWLVPVFLVPAILFLLVFLVNEIVVVPLVLLLVAFVFRAALITPLALLLVVVLLGVYYSSQTGSSSSVDSGSRLRDENRDQGWFGLGAFLLVMLFLIVSTFFCEGECSWWISLILVLPFLYFFSVS